MNNNLKKTSYQHKRAYFTRSASCIAMSMFMIPTVFSVIINTATAQSVTVTGENALISGNVKSPVPPFTALEWSNPTSDVAIGTNLTGGNSEPAATGSVIISDGGSADSNRLFVGLEKNTAGSVEITGAGSKWTNNYGGHIGDSGKGLLNVKDGGLFYQTQAHQLHIGAKATGVGSVVVDGVNTNGDRSTIDVQNRIFVGEFGAGSLNVTNGGLVNGGYTIFIGAEKGSFGNAIVDGVNLVSGDRSTLTTKHNNIQIGDEGSGSLSITNGGIASAPSLVTVGVSDGGIGILNVDGVNSSTGDRSTIDAPKGIWVGGQGQGEMNVTNGAYASSDDHVYGLRVGINDTGVGVVNIDGHGSEIVVSQTARIGEKGAGILNLMEDGTLSAVQVDLALDGTSSGILNIGTGGRAGFLHADLISGGAGSAAVNFNHVDDDYVFHTKMTGKLAVNHQNIGTTTLDAVNDYSGETNVSAGTLRSGQLGSFSSKSDFHIGINGILDANGNNETLKSLTNVGVLAFNQAGNNVGTILTIEGNYLGEHGTIAFNTALVGDDSATDKLIINGSTIGTTNVLVTNKDGLGAQTNNGIELITVGNDSNGIFNLAGDYEHNGEQAIVAGAYAYQLQKGALDNPDNGNWYLRSALKNGDSKEPLYQAGVPVYEAYPQLLLGLNSLPTLQQRVGNRYWSNAGNKILSQGADVIEAYAPAEEAGVVIEGNGVWGRIEGSHTKIKSKTSTSGTDYDYNTFKMQAGLDGLLTETENGKLIGGVTVHYAHGKADVYSAHGNGDIKTNGYGFGGTLTWYGENGFYVDNQAQLTWYDSDLNSSTANKSLKHGNNGFGYALSVEAGKRITIDENWSVTPQAQLMYSNVRFDSFTDAFGARISKKRADSLQGRIGISADYQNSWMNDQGTTNRSKVYGIANLYNEFLNGTKVDVSGVSFTNKRETLWAGIGLGGSYNWNDDKYSIFGEGSINTSLKNFGDSYNYKGTVGLRVKW